MENLKVYGQISKILAKNIQELEQEIQNLRQELSKIKPITQAGLTADIH